MRREARRSKDNQNWWEDKRFITGGSIVALTLALVVGVSMFSNQSGNRKTAENKINSNQIISLAPEEEINTDTESASSSIGNTVEQQQAANNTNTTNTITVNNTTANNTTNSRATNSNTTSTDNENAVNTSANTNNEEINFAWPVKGEILKEFSRDNLLYSATLQEWVTHNGVDIKADKTSVVTAAADGTVKSIKNDPRYGLTVIIEHANGYKTMYSNLLTAEFVVEGEKVTQGQSIGTVGNSANFEVADESHLHFEILKDSEYVDPTIYLK